MKKLSLLSLVIFSTVTTGAFANVNTPTEYGDGATAGNAGTAIGHNATATDGGTAIGSESMAAANNSIAIGGQGGGYGALAEGSIAIGTIAKTTGENSIAMGAASEASADSSVAIGSYSVADRANTVSFGSSGNERQLVNVAAGTADTDAVNVAQLNDAKNEAISYTDSQVTNATNDMRSYTDKLVETDAYRCQLVHRQPGDKRHQRYAHLHRQLVETDAYRCQLVHRQPGDERH
ncbi:hypothetical protein [Enterobacter quasiroggenkampii]|uniref:hypothetical protein n=1 Tax=Enterobacter quasiroggenkampii TaxID=2497436 RepID=UPI0023EEDA68|nr:hypothetical protein [Enterobacter quasiroggenkampii]